PHNFVVNFQYDVPVPASVKSHALANTVLGGWQVGGIYARQSGGAYNVKITTDPAFTGNSVVGAGQGGQRPDYLGHLPGCSPTEGPVTLATLSRPRASPSRRPACWEIWGGICSICRCFVTWISRYSRTKICEARS